jgi:hypothetical protein
LLVFKGGESSGHHAAMAERQKEMGTSCHLCPLGEKSVMVA